MPTGNSVVYNVQVLRAIAAFLVVFHHVRDFLNDSLGPVIETRVGASGVDIFFVISGFIMVMTTRGAGGEPGPFLVRRIQRIVPIYWLVTFVVFALILSGAQPIGNATADGSWINLFKSLFFIPYSRINGEMMPLLGVGWTLNFEMFFYVIFALALFLPRTKVQLAFITCVFILLIALGAWLKPEAPPLVAVTHPMLLEFLAGCFVGAAFTSLPKKHLKHAAPIGLVCLTLGVLALIVLSILDVPLGQLFWWRPLIWGIPAIAIVIGALACEAGGLTVRSKTLLLLGDASYAIYLVHVLVLQSVRKVIDAVHPEGTVITLVLAAMMFAAAVLAGVMVHLWIERPITRLLKQRAQRKVSGDLAAADPRIPLTPP